MRVTFAIFALAAAAIAGHAACGGVPIGDQSDAWPEPDPPPDPRVDGDLDYGGDADGDADGDVEPPSACGEGECGGDGNDELDDSCRNGFDEDGDGLVDCADRGCLDSPSCCAQVDASWVEGDFELCDGLHGCGWTSFVGDGDGDAVGLEEGVAILGGDGLGEVGFFSERVVGLTGTPTLTFLARLAPGECTVARCRQALGVAFTSQEQPSSGTGVEPFLGLVLDGEQGAVHFYVEGRLEATRELPLERLTELRGYGIGVDAEGDVMFWAGLEVLPGRDPDLTGPATYVRTGALEGSPQRLRVAAFGRLEGAAAAEIEQIHLRRSVCDVPAGWERVGDGPVLTATAEWTRFGRPAVAESEDGGLVMVLEADDFLAVSTSDDGESWSPARRILADRLPTTQYGRVAQRAPALIHWGPDGQPPRWHLWFEGEAEAGADTPRGTTPTAILHGVSSDGLAWSEEEEPVVLTLAPGPGEAAEVREPAVAALPGGRLLLVFVGRDPSTGATSLYRATSADGKEWSAWSEAIQLHGSDGGGFETDGIGQPTVVHRRGALHLWYVGRSGARFALGYGISGDEGARFERLGLVLGAANPWESRRIRGPAVVARPAETAGTERLLMWFEAGPAGLEQIGLAARLVPADAD